MKSYHLLLPRQPCGRRSKRIFPPDNAIHTDAFDIIDHRIRATGRQNLWVNKGPYDDTALSLCGLVYLLTVMVTAAALRRDVMIFKPNSGGRRRPLPMEQIIYTRITSGQPGW